MKNRINIISLIISLLPALLLAQVRQEKDFERSFSLSEDAMVEVINKYGEVIVQTWELDSIRIKAVVHAEGRNSSMIRKSMEKVNVRFRQVGSLISATTQVSSGNGTFSNLLGDKVQGVVGSNNKVKINYEVWIPENVALRIENKFGDVYLSDLSGEVDLSVSHGDIKANRIHNRLNITQSFGKSSFREIKDGKATLRGVKVEVKEAGRLDVESGSSEVLIDKADHVEFNSKNDEISIAFVKDLSCRGSFTDLTVDYLERSANLNFSYGDIHFSHMNQYFDLIDISSKSTDIDLVLNQASFIKADIKGSEDRMILPNSMLLMQKEQLEGDVIRLKGEVGNSNVRLGRLSIDAEKGELIIAIKETPIFTDKD